MRVVYVAGPFRGKDHYEIHKNICAAETLALEVWKTENAALCPHLNTAHFQDTLPDHIWLDGDLEMLLRCDALILTPDWERSKGAQAERQFAIEHNIPVFTNILDLQVWLSCQS